jgi:CBS domain-containing protein
MIPLDLRLTIGKTETIEDAKRKLEKYHGRYNALILVEEGVRPIGIITSDLLEKNSKFGQTKLGEITFIPDVYGYLSHSADDIKGIMKKF